MEKRRRIWMLVGSGAIVALVLAVVPRFIARNLELPHALGSLQLTQEVRGEKARMFINEMHGKGVAPKANMIGVYENSKGTATIYLSAYDNSAQSEKTYLEMLRGIEKGTTPFSHLRHFTIHRHRVSFYYGFGQAHYFFSFNESVYWLTADVVIAEEAAEHLLSSLKGESLFVEIMPTTHDT